MKQWRTRLWSLGAGPSRLSCSVVRTDKWYLVDVHEGETCIGSEEHPTREAAVRRALALEKQHRSRTAGGSQAANASMRSGGAPDRGRLRPPGGRRG